MFFTGENREKRLIFALRSPILKVKKAAVSGRERYEKLRDHHRQGKRKQRPRHRRGVGRAPGHPFLQSGYPADDSGINEQLFANAEKSFRSSLLFRVAKDAYNGEVIPPDSDNFVSNENLFRYQAKVMLGLAQNESCVMIGRCADFILRDRPNVLRVFIHAPEEVRVRRVMQRHNLSEAEARRHMRQVDKRRADYYRAFTGSDWRDAGHYDICFDSDHMGEEKIIRFIMGYMNVCFED